MLAARGCPKFGVGHRDRMEVEQLEAVIPRCGVSGSRVDVGVGFWRGSEERSCHVPWLGLTL